jgi:hypothetical protein
MHIYSYTKPNIVVDITTTNIYINNNNTIIR